MKILTFTVYYLISINILALLQKGALNTKKVVMMAELNDKVTDDFIGLVIYAYDHLPNLFCIRILEATY